MIIVGLIAIVLLSLGVFLAGVALLLDVIRSITRCPDCYFDGPEGN